MEEVRLVKNGEAMPLYVDRNSADYKGLSIILETFSEDIKAVTGVLPKIVTEKVPEPMLIAGSIGACELIDEMAADGKVDISDIEGKREVFKISEVDGNLVIIGSDRIAAIFGIFHISEKIGVSPWIYWGDVKPKQQSDICFAVDEICHTSKEPSVRYRGFFMNDEWPSLGNFVENTFGDFNTAFYRKVFELLLRLKGNYIWPAMWSASFSLDGGDGNPLGNMELSDALGITACFSHHEPMTRASEEWDKVKSNKNGSGYGADWNYNTNADGLNKYWADGLERDKHLNNMIVIGMRGERDTSMLGRDSTVRENVELLRKIISDQQKIIKEKDCENMPQMLALYKEVEDYYYGDAVTKGLCDWDALEPVTLLLSDDNFGNIRRMPPKEQRDRKAGWGLYYHFDYHGGPISYEWISSMPLQKTWEQVSMAYDYGIRDIWVVNVGDLRPQEVPLSYYMELAYDFESWGTDHPNKTRAFLEKWVEQQFGAFISDGKVKQSIVEVLIGYARMNGNSKPESTFPETYHITHFNEAKRKLEEFTKLAEKAEEIKAVMPPEAMDAFFGLVYYPAVAGVNLQKANIYAALNQWYAKNGASVAKDYKAKVDKCIQFDKELTHYYHEVMAGGKWKGMMMSEHFCFESWDEEGCHYPTTTDKIEKPKGKMLVHAENSEGVVSAGNITLPEINNISKKKYQIEIINGTNEPISYELSCNAAWIQVSRSSGDVEKTETISISVDWDTISESSNGVIVISGAGQVVEVEVRAKVMDTLSLPKGTFVPEDGIICMEAEHFVKSEPYHGYEWKKLDEYGKTLSSMKIYPTTENFDEIGKAPSLTYRVLIEEEGDYTLRGIVAPTNILEDGRRMRYAVAVDESSPVEADTLTKDFFVGAGFRGTSWATGVLENAHKAETELSLSKGLHEITVYGLDAGVVLQRFVLYKGELPESFFGPEESGQV